MYDEWMNELPDVDGEYWFYGYMWGHKDKKEWQLIGVMKISNGYLYTYKNSFIEKKDLDGIFHPVYHPMLPEELYSFGL